VKRYSSVTVFTVCCLTLLALHCNQQPRSSPDTRAADEAAIRQVDIAWAKDAAAGETDAVVAYYADDAMVLPPNEPMATSQEAIRKAWAEMLAAPGLGISWHPTKVEVARSGDIGYSVGTYEITINDSKGNRVTDRGKYFSAWKKQPDGSWKSAVDTWNSDLPAALPSK
jgi:ketosteroid isomerase-like protein